MSERVESDQVEAFEAAIQKIIDFPRPLGKEEMIGLIPEDNQLGSNLRELIRKS